MILALIIEAFKLSLVLGGLVVFLLAALSVFHFILTEILPIPFIVMILVATLIHRSYLIVTCQHFKYEKYYGKR